MGSNLVKKFHPNKKNQSVSSHICILHLWLAREPVIHIHVCIYIYTLILDVDGRGLLKAYHRKTWTKNRVTSTTT